MSLPPTHGCSRPRKTTRRCGREREVDVAGRPAESERRRSDADADRAVSPVGAAVRIGAGHELAGQDQPLFGKVEVEDAVARRRVIRPLEAVQAGERAADGGLLVVGLDAGEDEVIVGDGCLAREDRASAGDLVERVDRKRRGAVRGRKQVGVDAQRHTRAKLGRRADPCRRDAPRRSARWWSSARPAPAGPSRATGACGPSRRTRAGRRRRCRRSGESPLPSPTAAPACRSCPA